MCAGDGLDAGVEQDPNAGEAPADESLPSLVEAIMEFRPPVLDDRHDWAESIIVGKNWREMAPQARKELEDTDLRHCDQWHASTRESDHNQDTERMFKVQCPPTCLHMHALDRVVRAITTLLSWRRLLAILAHPPMVNGQYW